MFTGSAPLELTAKPYDLDAAGSGRAAWARHSSAAPMRAQTITVGPEPGERRAERSRPAGRARTLGEERRPIGLVQAIVERGREELLRAGGERGAEQRGSRGAEGRVLVRHADRQQRTATRACRPVRPGRSAIGTAGTDVGEPLDAAVPGQAGAAGERGGEVVGMTFERQSLGEQRLGVGFDAGGDRAGDEAERDHGRGRAEAALDAGSAYVKSKRRPVGGARRAKAPMPR